MSDQSTGTDWGCNGVLIGSTANSIGADQANTTDIVNLCPEIGIAAELADSYSVGIYTDWYFPS